MTNDKPKHTPGPWHLIGLSIESKNRWIASCDSRESNDNDKPNARLIAAAPEMLEALRNLYKRVTLNTGDCTLPFATPELEQARAAIAKAQ